MTLGVYSNSYIPKEKYGIKNSNPFNNTDSNGHNSFLEDYLQEESGDKKIKKVSQEEDPLDTLYDYTPSQSKINDYIDNFLLVNAEQVACSNMTQHLIRSDELKETLVFLNNQAAKTMFNGKKKSKFENSTPKFKTGRLFSTTTNAHNTTGIDKSTNNFFLKNTLK